MHHETTPDRPRQPWAAPRLVEQPAVNDAAAGGGPGTDALASPSIATPSS